MADTNSRRSVFDAGVVLLLAACQRYHHSSPETTYIDVDDLFRHVDTCLTVLAFCSGHDIAASRLHDMLDPVFCILRQINSTPTNSRPGPGSGADEEMTGNEYTLGSSPLVGMSLMTIANHLLNLMSPGAKVWA
jgi:hypothetical protein